MHSYIPFTTVLFFATFVSVFAQIETDVKKIQEVCDQAVKNRLKIKQWHVKLDCVNTGLHADSLPISYTFYVDGNRKREDVTAHTAEGKIGEQFHLQDDDYYYSYLKTDNQIDPTLSLYQAERQGRYAPKDKFILDFRAFGYTPYGFGIHNDPIRRHMIDVGGGPRLKAISMQDDGLNGFMCKKITMTLIDDVVMAFWLAVDFGYLPIRFETRNPSDGFEASTEVELARYKNTDIWVPIKMVEDYFSGVAGEPRRKIVYTTTVYSINEPIDAKWFSPESLGLPPGTPVAMVAEKPLPGPPVWDGKKTVTEGELLVEQATNKRIGGYRYALIAIGLAFISVALVMKYFAAKKTEA